MSNKTLNNTLLGIVAFLAGTWLMLELREQRREAAEEMINAQVRSFTKITEDIQQRELARQERYKKELALKIAEAEQKKAEASRQKAADELAMAKAKKEYSNECQFWRLQKKQGTSDKADEKIERYCNI